MRKLIVIGLVTGMVILSVGCAHFRKVSDWCSKVMTPKETATASPALINYQAPDVPVPSNFRHLPNESLAYQNGYVRTVYLKYLGNARSSDMVEFYRKQMPVYGWIERISNPGIMLFEKGKEKCQIEIVQSLAETNLVVRIGYYRSPPPDPYRKS